MIVTEVHIPQGGCPAIGIVTSLEHNIHLVVVRVGDKWRPIVTAASDTEAIFPAPTNAMLDIPVETEGELNRRFLAAMRKIKGGSPYFTESYPSSILVDVFV